MDKTSPYRSFINGLTLTRIALAFYSHGQDWFQHERGNAIEMRTPLVAGSTHLGFVAISFESSRLESLTAECASL